MQTKKKLNATIQALNNEIAVLKMELNNLKTELEKNNNLADELDQAQFYLQNERDTNQSLKKVILSLSTRYTNKELYDFVSSVLDPDGFQKYWIAKEITKIDVFEFYPYEDNCGRFEDLTGHQLYEWLIQAAFGNIEWIPLDHGYEKAHFISFEEHEEDLKKFETELYERLIKKIFK